MKEDTMADRVDNGECVVEVRGALSDHTEQGVMERCSAATRDIVLELSGMDFMNSAAAGMLVRLAVLAGKAGWRLRVRGVSEHYREVLRLIGLDGAISIEAGGAAVGETRDAGSWAVAVPRLRVPQMPPQARNINVDGRRAVGPMAGFGQLWQKTYRLAIDKSDIKPADAIRALKENFPSFQPPYNRFYPSAAGITPGEIVLIDSSTPGGPVSTGVMVLYADDVSFTFITPQGHPESGWVTFSAFEEGGRTVVQVQGLARAGDPLYEAAFRLAGSKIQIRIWTYLLESLARHLGVEPRVEVKAEVLDGSVRWSQVGNLWHNAQVRTLLYVALSPLRRISRMFKR
jgi:anti-anti-sigma factor